MQIKTIMRQYFIPTRMAVIKMTMTNVGKVMEKLESSYIANGNVK